MRYQPGDEVTILPPYDRDPYIVEFQPHGRVAQAGPHWVTVELPSSWPPGQQVGPFPLERIAPGWRDERGRWRATA
jgi:hypothetical protein